MANFYGTVTGNTSQASRCGTKTSGLKTTAQSWKGSLNIVVTEIKQDLGFGHKPGDIIFSLQAAPKSTEHGIAIFSGTLDELINALGVSDFYQQQCKDLF